MQSSRAAFSGLQTQHGYKFCLGFDDDEDVDVEELKGVELSVEREEIAGDDIL